MIDLKDHAEGVILPVRAQPGARKSCLVGEHAGALKVAVTAPARDGRANDMLVEVLRQGLGLKRSQIELVGGALSRDKRFLVRDIKHDELLRRVAAALA